MSPESVSFIRKVPKAFFPSTAVVVVAREAAHPICQINKRKDYFTDALQGILLVKQKDIQ